MKAPDKTTVAIPARPTPPIRFDPHYYKSQLCPKECTDKEPCKHPVHGGLRMARLIQSVPKDEWTDALTQSICFCCACQAGAKACLGWEGQSCLCHGESI